jgi:diguanylate cyclase (GGDEF)-like protein
MILPLKRFFRNASAAANALFGLARHVDYRALNRYILSMNQGPSLDLILQEAALCLKEILNYHLFAFAVQEGEHLDVWIDPRIYHAPLMQVIQRDFNTGLKPTFHSIQEQPAEPRKMVAIDGVLSYSLIDEGYQAKMYLLPERHMLPYHREILEIIVKTLGIALKNHLSIKRLKDDVAMDPLTGCYNRRGFERLLSHHVASAQRHGRDLSLIMFDIDHFKQVNDTYGHPAGDAVLKAISQAVLRAVRKGDYLARYGGEEFIVVLPDTQMPRAIELANRLRGIIEALDIPKPDGGPLRKTASFGVACLRQHPDRDALIRAADTMLYEAKAGGRNRVMPAIG